MANIELLTAKEAAAFLKVSVVTLAKWRGQKKGPAYTRTGRTVKYDPESPGSVLEEEHCRELGTVVQSEKGTMENDERDKKQGRTHVAQEADFSPQGAHELLPERRSDTGKEKGIPPAREDVKPGCPVCTSFAQDSQ